jgi:hypothetical protein
MAREGSSYPRKYWWVVVVALPVILALIAIMPSLSKKPDKADKPAGGIDTSIKGNNNTVSNVIDNSSKMTVINNVSLIASEYEKFTGQALTDDLKQQIERAVAAAVNNNHSESIRLLEQVVSRAPVPAIYNNLGVEYARTQNVDASQRALNQAIAKDPANEQARKNLTLLTAAGDNRGQPSTAAPRPIAAAAGPGVRVENGSAPTLVVERFDPGFAAVEGIHVVETGAGAGGGMYTIKYQPEPGTPVLVEPNVYDLLVKTSGGGVFLLAAKIQVKEGTLVRINPNALVGGVAILPLTRSGFPELKKIMFVDRATGHSRLIRQSTEKFGVTLPVAPGAYDVLCATADDHQVDLVRNLEIKAGEQKRIDPNTEAAAIVVHEPSVRGLNVKAIYALRAGTNEIAGKSTTFGKPMMVYAGDAYDVALEQPAGLTRIRSKLTPSRGALTEVR